MYDNDILADESRSFLYWIGTTDVYGDKNLHLYVHVCAIVYWRHIQDISCLHFSARIKKEKIVLKIGIL